MADSTSPLKLMLGNILKDFLQKSAYWEWHHSFCTAHATLSQKAEVKKT